MQQSIRRKKVGEFLQQENKMGAKEMWERYKEYRDKEMQERAVRKKFRKKRAAFERDVAKSKEKKVPPRKFSGARYLAAMPGVYGEQGRMILRKRKKAKMIAEIKRKKAEMKKKRKIKKKKTSKKVKTVIIYKKS